MDYLNNSLISTLGLEKEGILARFALSFQIILCSECFVTILAAEWYLSGVDFFKLVYKLPYVWNTLTHLDWLNVFHQYEVFHVSLNHCLMLIICSHTVSN